MSNADDYVSVPGRLVGNLHMLTEDRYAALLAAEARLAAVEPIVAAAVAFIADSESAGGPPSESCHACYWTLRAAVTATGAVGAGEPDGAV